MTVRGVSCTGLGCSSSATLWIHSYAVMHGHALTLVPACLFVVLCRHNTLFLEDALWSLLLPNSHPRCVAHKLVWFWRQHKLVFVTAATVTSQRVGAFGGRARLQSRQHRCCEQSASGP